MVFCLPPSVPSSRFAQTRHSDVLCFLERNITWKRKRCTVSLGLKSNSPERLRTGSRISRGTDPPRRGTKRRRETFTAAISAAGGYLRAQPVRGCLSQSAASSVESSVQIRLGDPPDARTRCLSSLQYVRTSSAPRRVGPCRPRCLSTNSVGSQIKCRGMGVRAGQTAHAPGQQTVSTTQNQISGNGTWRKLEVAATFDWRQLSRRIPLRQTKCQKTAHQPGAFPGLCTVAARACVRLPLFASKQQTAHISVSTSGFDDGEEPAGHTSSLWVSRFRTEAWRVGPLIIAGICCLRTPESAPQRTFPSLPLPLPLLYVFICARWFLRVGLLTKFDWLSLRREPKASFGSRPLPASETANTGISSSHRRAKHHPSPTSPLCSLFAVADPCSPAAFRLRSIPPVSAPAKPWEVDAPERSRRARSLLIQAALGAERGRTPSSSRPLQSFPIPARQRLLVGLGRHFPNSSFRQRSR